MQKDLQPIFNESGREKAGTVTLAAILDKAVEFWPLFISFIAIFLIGAYVYLRYSTPVYQIQSKVYIKDNTKGGMAEGQVFQDLGVRTGVSTIENEIEILKSRNLMKRVVEELNLNIRYLTKGRIKTSELYKNGPFGIIPLYDNDSIKINRGYKIDIKGNNFDLTEGNRTFKGVYGDTIKVSIGDIVVVKNNDVKPEFEKGGEFFFTIGPIGPLAKEYSNALTIEPVNKLVSIIRILINDIIPERGEDIIDKLIEVYIKANIDDRNRVINGTIEFVDDRLIEVKRDLSNVETEIEVFKRANNIANIDEQSKMLFANTNDNTKQLTQNEVQLRVIESLTSYLQTNKNNTRVVPSAFFVNDVSLNNLINNYNALQGQKESLLLTNTENSPYVRNLDLRLENSRKDILGNLTSAKRSLEASISELNSDNLRYNTKIKTVPASERIFLEYSRQQNIIEQLYLFLLKKREETAISKSATVASARVIDPAQAEDSPVAPNGKRTFLIAFVIGILIPGGWVFIKELLNVKISSKADIGRITIMPIIGEIGHNHTNETLAIKKDSRSQLSEQFRVLRTNLQFLLANSDEKTILITSSMSGEGKSFVAINLASTLALLNKRVVLLELDLRKPKVSVHFGIDNNVGLSSYAIGKAGVEDIIKPSGVLEGLYIIPSGAIPPNPAELITLPKVTGLITQLKKDFDYVVLDTAPVGLVTDAQLLNSHADIVLYVVREAYTFKQQVETSNDLFMAGKMKRMSIVMNDIRVKRGYNYGYGYGSYSNGYFDVDNEKANIKKRRLLRNNINKI